jgi:hypothetical protein
MDDLGVPPEISAILASPEEIAVATAALFLRLRHVVNTENTAPPEVEIEQERKRAWRVCEAIIRFIDTTWHDPGRLEVQRYFLLLDQRAEKWAHVCNLSPLHRPRTPPQDRPTATAVAVADADAVTLTDATDRTARMVPISTRARMRPLDDLACR